MDRITVQSLIAEQNRVKSAILAHKKANRSPMDIFQEMVGEMLDKRAKELKDEVLTVLKEATPVKGVHYFDGEKGNQGEKGEDSTIAGPKGETGERGQDGIDGRDGKDGKNISPKEARMIIKELLNDLSAADFGAISKKDAETMLKTYDGKSSKTLEKRLTALQDAVFRNYGGHGGSKSGAGNNFAINEVVSGSGTAFTLANTPIAGTVAIYALGQRLTLTTDYTISGAHITTVNSWLAGQILCDYQY